MTSRRRTTTTIAVSVVVAAALASGASGCSGPRVIGDEYDGAGPGALATDPADLGPAVGWVTEGERFYVTTYGSSSCPVAPTRIETGDRGPVLTMSRTGGPACTADLGPTSYALDLPDRSGPGDAVVVSLRFDDRPEVDLPLPLSRRDDAG